MSPGGARRASAALVAFAGLVGVVAIATGRAVIDGEAALADADSALRRHDFVEATARARAAASWYVPGAAHVPAAYARLVHIARTAEAEGDREAALLAWRSIRAAAVESRWLVQPHQRELDLSSTAIARLEGEAGRASGDREGARIEAARGEAPTGDFGSRGLRSLVLVGGLALLCVGAVTSARPPGGPGPKSGRSLRPAHLMAAAGLALYVGAIVAR